jgi:ABC-2 type transport system permease protein
MTTRIICVVDNDVKKDSGLKSEHGLSFWIETKQGNVLFDSGQTGAGGINWLLLILALLLSSAVFSALGAFVSVTVKEIFEAQTLANFIRFPMMFLGGVFVPVNSLPFGLQIVARFLPLTYSVEIIQSAMLGTSSSNVLIDIIVLAAFTIAFYALAVRALAKSLD